MEWTGGGGGEKGLAGMVLLLLGVGVLAIESGGGCGGCWGDTKGLAGVTKGMVVGTINVRGPAAGGRVEAAAAFVSAALVARRGSRAHRHGVLWGPVVFLLDRHCRHGAVEGARRTPGVLRRGGHGSGRGGCRCVATLASSDAALRCGGHRGMEGRELLHHPLVLVLLVGVDRLCMLAQVVQARELLPAVTGEWSFPSMFSIQTQKKKYDV